MKKDVFNKNVDTLNKLIIFGLESNENAASVIMLLARGIGSLLAALHPALLESESRDVVLDHVQLTIKDQIKTVSEKCRSKMAA